MALEENNKKYEERMIRLLSQDIEGRMTLYSGLTKIKGISWGMSNAICKILKLDKRRKMGSLTDEELGKIKNLFKNPEQISPRLLNRQKDFETKEDKHLTGGDLELQTEFDIKRKKKIKSYRGLRHAAGLPLRGQRTKSNFRKNRKKGTGIKSKTKKKK